MGVKVLFLPGLGDHRSWGQDKLIRYWRLAGMEVYFHRLGWRNQESFEAKLGKTISKIDKLTKNSDKIAVIGVSAGASMAVNAYSARKSKVRGVIFICGKIQGHAKVNPRYYEENPALRESLIQAEAAVAGLTDEDKHKMLTFRAWLDKLIPVSDSTIPGVKGKVVPSIGHIFSIFLTIMLYLEAIARFIKSR